jgi:hypothetical protein
VRGVRKGGLRSAYGAELAEVHAKEKLEVCARDQVHWKDKLKVYVMEHRGLRRLNEGGARKGQSVCGSKGKEVRMQGIGYS